MLVVGQHLSGVQVLRAVREDRARRASAPSSRPTTRPPPTSRARTPARALTEQPVQVRDLSRRCWPTGSTSRLRTAVNKVETVRERGEEEVHRRAGADEAADRGGQAADRLRRAVGDLPLHRQADARPRPLPGDLPGQSARRRRQGIRLHHRLQGPVQEPRRRGARLHLAARWTATTRRTWPGCWRTAWRKARERLEEAREAVKALCEPVEPPRDSPALPPLLLRQRSGRRRATQGERAEAADAVQVTSPPWCAPTPNSPTSWRRRVTRAAETAAIKAEVDHYENVARRSEACAAATTSTSRLYEPAMRHLIDTYIRAEESEKVSAFDDMSPDPADRRARRRRGGGAAEGHPRKARKPSPRPSRTTSAG